MSGSSGSVAPSSQPLVHQRALGVGGEEGAPVGDGADRVDQVGVGGALEHVAGRAGLERLEEVALVVVHREQQHARVGARARGSRAPPGARSCAASTRRAPRRRAARPGAARAPRRRPRPRRRRPCRPGARSACAGRSARCRGRRRSGRGSRGTRSMRSVDRVPPPGAEQHLQLAADQPRALGHAAQAEAGAARRAGARDQRGRSRRRRRGRAARRRPVADVQLDSTAVAPAWRPTFASASWATR